jgi:hypothetical protein
LKNTEKPRGRATLGIPQLCRDTIDRRSPVAYLRKRGGVSCSSRQKNFAWSRALKRA